MAYSFNTPEYIWVEQSAQLEQLCQFWNTQKVVAIDTEFMRSHTYFPQPALLQVYDGKQTALIDPIALDDIQPLCHLMQNPAVEKVLHAGSEDVEVLHHWLGVLPQALFDTQIAGAYAGFGFSLGYAKLLQEVLNIDVPKSETRSDWLQRPLSQAQIHYAVIDVYYLLDVYEKIKALLETKNRTEWAREDGERLVQNHVYHQNFEHFYLRLKSAWKLKAEQLAVLKALCIWREKMAVQRDVPRNRVLKENLLYSLAISLPKNKYELSQIDSFPERNFRTDSENILNIIQTTLDSDPEQWPDLLPQPLSKSQRGLLAELKGLVDGLATELNLPSELLLRKKDYESIIRSRQKQESENTISYQLPEIFQGWRGEVLAEPLLKYLSK